MDIKKLTKAAIIYFILLVAIILLLGNKQNFMEDELLTYNLANGKGWLAPENGFRYEPASSIFMEYMTTDGHLNIKRVWDRQRLDVHPPFYYLLVHLICVLFPGSVSIRYAGAVNILFQLLTLFVIRKILDSLGHDEKIKTILSLTFVLSAGLLSTTSLLRMYVMLAFWITLITYIHIRNLKDYDIKTYIAFFLVTVSGALTHYHYILFVFFISLVAGIFCLVDKRFKDAIGIIITMVLSGIVSYLIFPAMVSHMFLEYRGTESIDNLKNANLFERLSSFYFMTNVELAGGLLTFIIISIIMLMIIGFASDNKSLTNDEIRQYVLILVPTFCFFVFVSKSVGNISDRYVSPIFPILLIGTTSLFYKLICPYMPKDRFRYLFFGIFMTLCVVISLIRFDWHWLYRDSKPIVEYAEQEGQDTDAICFYKGSWRIMPSYLEMIKFRSITFYDLDSGEDIEEIMQRFEYGEHQKVCYFCAGLSAEEEDFVKGFITENGHPIINEQSFGYSDSYYVIY